jgi:hypothetical protein
LNKKRSENHKKNNFNVQLYGRQLTLFMIPFLLSQVGTHYREADQLKTMMPNGSLIYCESREAPYVSVQLILNNRDTPDQLNTYGYRHLIEHIAARSIPGHDFEIETGSGYLFASTNRDWMKFEWRLPGDKIDLAYKGISALLKGCGVTEESIKRESIAISRELDLSSSNETASRTAWSAVYGSEGLDPLGNRESVFHAKPEELIELWRKLTRGGNVVISACGSVDQKAFTARCKDLVSGLSTSKPGKPVGRAVDGSFGMPGLVAVPIPSVDTKQGVDALVAAFGLAGRLNRPFVTYTPSLRPGLALVGSADPYDSIRGVADIEDPATIFVLGRINILEWLKSRVSTPEGAAEFNGILLSLSPSLRPAKLYENFQLASFEDFKRTWALIKGVAK